MKKVNRRKFLKAIGIGALAPSALLASSKKKIQTKKPAAHGISENEFTVARLRKWIDENPPQKMAGIAVEDIPKDGWGWIMIRNGPCYYKKDLGWTQAQEYPLGTLLTTSNGSTYRYMKWWIEKEKR